MASSEWFPHSPFPIRQRSRLQRALHTRVHGVERRRATDIESVPLLAAEAQISHRLRNVDLAKQIAVLGVATHAVLVGVAPAHGAPDTPLGIAADPIGNTGLGHIGKYLAVGRL